MRKAAVRGYAGKVRRLQERRGQCLEDLAVSPKTLQRYHRAFLQILPELEQSPYSFDETLCSFINRSFEDGESLGYISDTLCAVQHFCPWVKRRLPESWRLFSIWKKVEKPMQALPLTLVMAKAFVVRALETNQLELALLILLGFWGLLRTGELLSLRTDHLVWGNGNIVLQLLETKTGIRHGFDENVVLRDPRVTTLVEDLCRCLPPSRLIWPKSAQAFRKAFHSLVLFFQLESFFIRPYSLRRGGATHAFRQTGLMEQVLILGRWTSNHAARRYIHSGTAALATQKFSFTSQALLHQSAALFEPTPVKGTSQARQRGRNEFSL